MKRISVGTVIAAMFACVVIADAMPERYYSGKRRIVSTDTATIPGSVITHYRQGEKEWSTTNVLKVVNVRRVIQYSKLKLIEAAKAAGKWADVKAFIQKADIEDEWNACQFITSDYPAYIAATNAVVSLGVATDAEVKAFMKAAED